MRHLGGLAATGLIAVAQRRLRYFEDTPHQRITLPWVFHCANMQPG